MAAAKKTTRAPSKKASKPKTGCTKKRIGSKAPKSDFIKEHIIIAKPGPVNAEPRIVIRGPMENNWTSGMVSVDGMDFDFQIKHYPEPSVYGIDKGCISKMTIWKKGAGIVVNYDRGWDIIPQGETVMKAYRAILDRFNNGMTGADYKRYDNMNSKEVF